MLAIARALPSSFARALRSPPDGASGDTSGPSGHPGARDRIGKCGADRRFRALTARHPLQGWDYQNPVRSELKATVKKIDRARRRLVVEASGMLQDVIRLGIADLDFDPAQGRFGILDQVVIDFFTRRLKETLSGRQGSPGIRNPPLAAARPLFAARIANVANLRPNRSASVPAETFIWNADVAAVGRPRARHHRASAQRARSRNGLPVHVAALP
jgi:hypothetical protein